jgi:hypothetical protein
MPGMMELHGADVWQGRLLRLWTSVREPKGALKQAWKWFMLTIASRDMVE